MVDWVKNRVEQDREAVLQDILLIYRSAIVHVLQERARQEAGN